MRTSKKTSLLKLLAGTATVFALGAAVTLGTQMFDLNGSAAWAQNEGNGGQGQGGQGEGSKGGDGQGQGGPGDDSEGQGPKAGSGGTQGGKPVWAQEGIPEVELGRLNVARSPDSVLQRAYDEAVATLTPEMVAFYNLSTAEMIEQLTFNFDNVAYIDSPLQNLALLKEALDGSSVLATKGVTTDATTLMAIFLAVASDKEGEGPTALVVEAVTTILGTPITGAAADALADEAHDIWVSVVAGHG